MRAFFNYVITVHNKELVLPDVLRGVQDAASPQARVVIVLDGCTDRSEQISHQFRRDSQLDVAIVTAPDVHEIKSINIGLRETASGYCVLLQDDVVLQEPELERKIHELCENHGRRLGVISLRLAADVREAPRLERLQLFLRARRLQYLLPMVGQHNEVAAAHEHLEVPKVPNEHFVQRMVGIKSPLCLTPELRRAEAFLDEQFAPYCYDDYDISLRSLQAGLVNGLYALRFRSDLEWGGTRNDPTFSSDHGARVRLRNRRLLWKKHGTFLKSYNTRNTR